MPIPSLAPSLKPRGQVTKARNGPSQVEAAHNGPPEDSIEAGSAYSALRPSPNPLPTSHTGDANGGKRRSFLPQPGESRYGHRKVGQEDAATQQRRERNGIPEPVDTMAKLNATVSLREIEPQDARQTRLRPRSLHQASFSGADARLREREKDYTGTSRPSGAVGKASVSHLASLSRSQSLRKPGIPTQPAQSVNTRSHLRTKSTSTVTGTRNPSAEHTSLPAPPSNPTKIIDRSSAHAISSEIRTSARLGVLKRQTSTRTKPEAMHVSESTNLAPRTDPDQTFLIPSLKRREAPKDKQPRPAFSTLQQHFTPRKTSKAPMSAYLHPPAQEGGAHPIPPEVLGLQAELLQLHILHQCSAEVSREWELSAKRSLRRKFEEVTSLYQVMREEERQGRERRNIQALQGWNDGSSSLGLSENIQILSGPLHELPSLVDTGGRFWRLADEFHHWVAWVESIQAARAGDVGEHVGGSAEGLGETWKVENAALTRKLTSFSQDLEKLVQPTLTSSIACIVATCKELLEGILNELSIMHTIEACVVAREKEWVEAQLRAIARDIGAHLGTPAEGEAWRM